jgi:hypothetical protein
VKREKQTADPHRAPEPVEGLQEIESGLGDLAQVRSEVRGRVRRASCWETKSRPFKSAAEQAGVKYSRSSREKGKK